MYINPVPTVDIIIETGQGIVLIERHNYPFGWALPGGFVDYGETVENAALREAVEETGMTVDLLGILGVYSDPGRDPRQHTISTVFVGKAQGMPVAGDDARRAAIFRIEKVDVPLVFDHQKILEDYRMFKQGRRCLCGV